MVMPIGRLHGGFHSHGGTPSSLDGLFQGNSYGKPPFSGPFLGI